MNQAGPSLKKETCITKICLYIHSLHTPWSSLQAPQTEVWLCIPQAGICLHVCMWCIRKKIIYALLEFGGKSLQQSFSEAYECQWTSTNPVIEHAYYVNFIEALDRASRDIRSSNMPNEASGEQVHPKFLCVLHNKSRSSRLHNADWCQALFQTLKHIPTQGLILTLWGGTVNDHAHFTDDAVKAERGKAAHLRPLS